MNLCIYREITEIILKECVTHKIIEKMPKKICILTYGKNGEKKKQRTGRRKKNTNLNSIIQMIAIHYYIDYQTAGDNKFQ